MRKTKIICTLGPATDNEKTMGELILAGMDVARFNFSHGDYPEHTKRLNTLVKLREELNVPVATLLDTKGPEVRLGTFRDGLKPYLNPGQTFTLTSRDIIGDESQVSISYPSLPKDIDIGTSILIDDGLVELTVIEINDTDIVCKVINGGLISDRKGVNVPGVELSIPFISEKDKSDIAFAVENDFDFVATSFVRTADDVRQMRDILDEHNSHMKIIAKIENLQGVNNIDEIIQEADGVMIARGDLGVEIPYEELPAIQKMIIEKVYHSGKHVITATQMLESMIHNPRPTRAEATDVANAIYDGTSVIMLSGETSIGKYPVEALKTMVKIARKTESDIDYKQHFHILPESENPNVTDAISRATLTTAHNLDAKMIITVTTSGGTARMVSRYRPSCPIIACTTDPKVLRQLKMSWGVTPLFMEVEEDTFELFDHAIEIICQAGYLNKGDLVVLTAGVPLAVTGTTNMIKVQIAGETCSE